MKEIEFNIDAEPKNNYDKAKKLLFETDKAIIKLTYEEQRKLAYEFAQYKGICNLFRMM